MGTVAQRQKELFDRRKVHGELLEEGQLVMVHNPVVPWGQSRKLHCPWSGPYKVVKRLSDAVYRVLDTRSRRQRQVIHFDRLKPCPPGMKFNPLHTTGNRRSGHQRSHPLPVQQYYHLSHEFHVPDDPEE